MGNTKVFTVKVPNDVYVEWQEASAEQGMSVGAWVKQACEAALAERGEDSERGHGSVARRFLRTEDVANLYGLSVDHIRLMAASGEIPARRLRGRLHWLFDPRDLEQWETGAALETVHPPGGGVITRPKPGFAAERP